MKLYLDVTLQPPFYKQYTKICLICGAVFNVDGMRNIATLLCIVYFCIC